MKTSSLLSPVFVAGRVAAAVAGTPKAGASVLLRAPLAICGLAAFLAIIFSPGIAGAEDDDKAVPSDLRVAVQKLVESRGFAYSGLCNEFVPPREPGTFCGNVKSFDANTANVTVGPLQGTQYQATFMHKSGTWTVNWHTLPVNVHSDLRLAIKTFLEGRLYPYAGLCSEIDAGKYAGHWCATLQSLNNDYAQFGVGPVGSSNTYQVTLLRKNGAWNLHTHNVPLNIPADLRLALRSLLESRGHVFAGICAEIDQSRYQGQWCAIVESISRTGAQFTLLPIGRTISYSATFIRKDGVWQVNSHNLPFNPSAELRLALKNFLESRGYEYAGLCEEIDQARNTARWCATPVTLSGDSARFTVGQVLSGTTYSVTMVRKGNAWTPAGDNVPFNVPSVIRSQLKTLIESRGYGYAGLCPEIDMSSFVGKWCAYPMLVTGDRAEFVVGAVYSSSSYKVTFVKRAGTWSVNSQNVPVNVPDGLRGAIRNLVESRGFRYAGLCLEIDQPSNVGKWCALVSGVPGDTAQVTIGPVLSDSLYAANFARHKGAWTPTTHKLPVNMPSELVANIKSLIESRGFTYAGLCETVDQGLSLGKACAFIRWEGETRVVVMFGRVATDEIHRAVFEHRAGAWMMISGDTTPVITPTPVPTNTPTPRPGNTPTPRPADPTPTPEPEHETPTPTPDNGEPETPTPTPDNGETPEPGIVVPQSLREAIAAYLARIGVDYLGLCEEIHVSEGATGSCAIVRFVDDAEARVIYGPVFGGDVRTVTFIEYSGEWLPVGGPEPVDDDSVFSLASFLLIGLAGIGVTGLGAGLYAVRNR